MTETGKVIVLAELERGGRTIRLLCPFCRGPRGGRRFHVHGAPDGQVTGPVLSHCRENPRTYYPRLPGAS